MTDSDYNVDQKMEGKVLKTVVKEDKFLHILFLQELSSNGVGKASLWDRS